MNFNVNSEEDIKARTLLKTIAAKSAVSMTTLINAMIYLLDSDSTTLTKVLERIKK